jgi:hypothetical protein
MAIAEAAKRAEIIAKLEEMGYSAQDVTGSRHYIPKPSEVSAEKKAISTIESEAIKNQLHYLSSAKKNKKPWHHNTKSSTQYSEYVLVSPDMAQQLLEWNNNPRKKLMQTVVDRYRADMASGEWTDTSQSIAIDYNGYLHNGQHRLNAIVQWGKPQRLYFTFNTLVSAREDEDVGAPRKPAVQIELRLHNRIGNKLPAICRAAMRGVGNPSSRISQAQLADFAEMYGPQIEWLERICPTYRSDVLAAFLKAILWYGIDRMEPFLKRFGDVLFESTDDPAKLLHASVKLHRGTRTKLSLYKKTLSAIHHHINGRKVSKLLERDVDIFEWDPGWKVPAQK